MNTGALRSRMPYEFGDVKRNSNLESYAYRGLFLQQNRVPFS